MLTSFIVGERIERARRRCGLSQTQLAQQLSISSQAVGKWERGESMPDIIMFNRIAQVLGVDLNYFSDSVQESGAEDYAAQDKSAQSFDGDERMTGSAGSGAFKDKGAGEESDEECLRTAEALDASGQRPVWNMSGWNWVDADFSGLKNLGDKFSGANITGCRFVDSDLSGLRLGGNRMVKNDFSKTDFSESLIRGAQITNNVFCGCRFNETVLKGTFIKDCDFSGADFSQAVFRFSHIQKNDMTGATLSRTEFHGCNLSDLRFEGAITDCSFVNCNFNKVTFENAVLTNTFFKCRTKKIQFINCKADTLTYAFLKTGKADLSGVTLIN